MHKLSASNKKRIINDVVIGARLYQKYLATKDFLIVADDGTYVEVRFHNSDFAHLVGIRSYLNDLSFYKNCVSGTIAENNIKDQQHYDFGTLRKKITLIKKIHKIIYTNSNVLLINLHTNTIDFPLAIENSEEKMLVAFVGKDLHARSLRKNNKLNVEVKKKIIGIFSKDKNSKTKYATCIYIKNYKVLRKKCIDLSSKVSVRLLYDFDKMYK